MASTSLVSAAGSSASDRIVPGASSTDAVSALLTSLNLQKYIGVFVANDIVTIPRLKAMQDVHYQRFGVSLGHQFDIVDRVRSYSDAVSESEQMSNQNASFAEPGLVRSGIFVV
jgi:hypothetical protein